MSKLKKSESINRLMVMDLNTLDYFMTEDPREATHWLAKHFHDKVSIRTERGDEFACPFHYQINGGEVVPDVIKHIEDGYKVLMSLSLDTAGCLFYGAIALTERGQDDIVEFVEGEGKVRELDNHKDKQCIFIPKNQIIALDKKKYPSIAIAMNLLYTDLCEKLYDERPCIIEFSYYNYSVGRLKKNEVFWEVRPYK